MRRWFLTLAMLLGSSQIVLADDNLKAFPAAEAGMSRYVLSLPAKPDESALQVELQIGKTVQADGQNRYFFAGQIEAQNIPGWGFTRYVVSTLGPMAGTLMAPVPGKPDVPRFVTLGGEPYLIRYNSKLPVVVYVPEGAEVRYRIWSAPADFQPVKSE
jgi:ecotin